MALLPATTVSPHQPLIFNYLRHVPLDTWSGNELTIRAYRSCGFQIEGRLRPRKLIDGAYYDTILMGLLREEWETLHAPTEAMR